MATMAARNHVNLQWKSSNDLLMVTIILIIMSTVPRCVFSSKAPTDQWAGVAVHQLRRPHAVQKYAMVPNQRRTAGRNKDAATTIITTIGSSLQHVGEEALLNLHQQLAHEHQNHPRLLLGRKALMRPTRRAIAAGQLLMKASSSLAANCDAVAIAITGSYRSWQARRLQAGNTFKLHPMKLFFLCATMTKIDKGAAKKTQNTHGVIPVVHSRRALKHLPPAPPLIIPPLPFTIPPLPITIPSPPGLTFPPLPLPPPITFPPFPFTFPPVLPLPFPSLTPPPPVQKASITTP